jgi:hypothetical protein
MISRKDRGEKQLADESQKTQKAREKLKKKLQDNDKKITPQALKKKSVEIHHWINRHAKHRIILKSKSISLFDENQNTARISQRIRTLVDQLSLY